VRLLLDTTALLWWLDDDARLGSKARAAIADPRNEIFVSAASAWEMSVKRASGKLAVSFDIAEAIERNAFVELPIGIAHAVAAGELIRHHADPFDRMLIAQSQQEGLRLVTSDGAIARYDVELLDATA